MVFCYAIVDIANVPDENIDKVSKRYQLLLLKDLKDKF